MATNWKSQQGNGIYSLQFETDDIEKYKLVEKASQMAIDGIADVVEVKHGENIGTLHPVDEFICSECGIVLEGWTKVVTDEDDGEMFYEYEFKYCPNCGAKMDGERKDVTDIYVGSKKE